MTTPADIEGWGLRLDEVTALIAPRFARAEPRRRGLVYLRGLLAPVERKNGWQLAEAAGDATPDGVQDFLSRMQWDADAVRDDLRSHVKEHLGDPSAVLVLDETGFVKKGGKSAGVQRQCCGMAGRVENCQIGVFLGREARIPETVAFTTKPKQGLAMLERARHEGLPSAWITGDSVHGADHAIRRWAERHRRGYVLTVTSAQRLGLRPVTRWIEDLPADAWQRLGAGEGAKEPRLCDWALLPCRGAAASFRCALLVRRSIAKPEEVTFYLTHAPEPTSLDELARVAGSRRSIESLFEQTKGEVGLDQYEVRSWIGWHRHTTLGMFALAYLKAVCKGAIGGHGPAKPGCRLAAPHRARGQAAALDKPRPNLAPTRRRTALVNLAATPLAACTARALASKSTGIQT